MISVEGLKVEFGVKPLFHDVSFVINDRIAAKRVAAVVWMLTKKYNIPSERITEESKGARVQPFAENAENRVTIMIAK